ncbi:MAG: 4Fe-4S binding protein [Candidatus Lokiarchaeota archaeon]|nr:4Fe-4S binding protein [Candidatus Lokiarchaeota archaeon]
MNIKSLLSEIKNRRTTTIRRIVQIIAFIVINYILIEQLFVLNLISLDAFLKVLPVLNAPKNPISNGTGILEMIFYSIIEGIFPLFLIALLVLVLLFTNRFFCGWICPIGTIQDVCAAVPTNKKRLKISTHNSLLKIKYIFVVLIIILIIPLGITATTNYDFYLDYRANLGDFGKNPMGYFSLSEYIFVFFPNMIKDMIVTGSLQPLFSSFLTFIIFFFYIALIILSVWYPRVYCRYFCPFAAVSSVISEYSFLKLSRNPVRCVGRTECGICEKVCPKQIRILDEPFEFFTGNGECNFCLKCKEKCPYNAIDMKFG